MRSGLVGSKGSAAGWPYDSMSRSTPGWSMAPGSSPSTIAVEPPISMRAGASTSRSYRPPAGTATRRPTTSDGWLTSRPSTASTLYGASVHTRTAPLSVFTTRIAGHLAGGRVDRDVALLAVEGPGAAVGVGDGQDVDAGVGLGGLHDQRPEEPPDHLLVGHLVGVVPVAAGVVDDEPVDVVLADADGVLGDAGDAVLGVGDVDAVPVHADAVLDVLVVHAHLEQVTHGRLDRRAGGGAVERVPLDLATRLERDRALAGLQVHDDVGRPVGVLDQVGDADRALVVTVLAAMLPPTPGRRPRRRTPCP